MFLSVITEKSALPLQLNKVFDLIFDNFLNIFENVLMVLFKLANQIARTVGDSVWELSINVRM